MSHVLGTAALSMSALATTALGGVETTEVRPQVIKLLESKNLQYATEVEFHLLDGNGNKVFGGRFDIVFRDPRPEASGALIAVETKGVDLEALTDNQQTYVRLMERPDGATIKITSRKGGNIALPRGRLERITNDHYVRVGRANVPTFADALEQLTSGERVKHIWLDADGLKVFKTTPEYQTFLEGKGMQFRRTGGRVTRVLAGGAKALAGVGVAGELLAPLQAAAEIDQYSANVGDLVGTSLRQLHELEFPHLKPLDGGRYYFSPRTGNLYGVETDLQALTDWNQLKLIETLYKPWWLAKFGLQGSDWWHSPVTGHTVFKDEKGVWHHEQFEEPGLLDQLRENIRTTWFDLVN